MQNKKNIRLIAGLLFLTLLSACTMGQAPAPTMDVGFINTQGAQLVATQFSLLQTQTAMAVPPSPLPSPTLALPTFAPVDAPTFAVVQIPTQAGVSTLASGFLPTATLQVFATASGPKCNDAVFTGQENVPDGTVMKPGIEFEKYWVIQNTGTCLWDDGYSFTYLGGTLDGYTIKFTDASQFVKPGAQVTFKVDLTASLTPNTYTDCWSMKDDKGYYFGQSPIACVNIVVKK